MKSEIMVNMNKVIPLKILETARCGAKESICDQCTVRDRAFCSALDDVEINELSAISSHKNYRAGETIFEEAAKISRFANIVQGTVKLTKLLPDGRQQITGFLFPGDFVGKVYSENHTTFVEAITDTQICTFAQGSLENLLEKHPHLTRRLFGLSNQSLERAEEWMLLLGRKTAREKIGSFLLLLSQRASERDADPDNIHLAMGRADIADYLGLTIETVSRQISKLKAEQVIRLGAGNMVHLNDRDTLQDLAEGA
jgi:CRP/FNR family transcriptional regulator